MLTAGTVVADHLRLVRQLGSGGMGSVWIAEQTRLGQHVAVKFLSTALLDHESARSRFDREAKLAAKIKSPHVVQIHDHGLTRGEPAIPYIVMELLDGQDLSKVLESEGALSAHRAFEILSQVCDALTKAHEAGIVHRDIKPENVFVLNESRTFVKLLDFGVAHGKDGQIDRLTQTGLLLGTAHYMSPEQLFSGKDIDHRADLWALAVLTYQMLSNELPFQAETFGQLCLRVRDGGFAPVSSRVAVLPGMDQWFARGLSSDRTGRFQSAAEMADTFRRLLLGESWESGASQAGSKSRENSGTVRVERSVIERGIADAREELARGDVAQRVVAKTERWGSQPGTSAPNPAAASSGHVGSRGAAASAVGSAGAGASNSAAGSGELSRGTLPSGEHPPFGAQGSLGQGSLGQGSQGQGSAQSGIGPNTPLTALEGSFGTEARGALVYNADSEVHKPSGRSRLLMAVACAAVVLGLGGVFVFRSQADSGVADENGTLAIGAASSLAVSHGASEVAAEVIVAPSAVVIEPLSETTDREDVDTAEIAKTPSLDPSASVGNTVTPPLVRPHIAKASGAHKANANPDGRATSKANADVASDQAAAGGGKAKPEDQKKPEKKYRGF